MSGADAASVPAIVDGAAWEFAQKPERPDTEDCGRQPEVPGSMQKALWEWGFGVLGATVKNSRQVQIQACNSCQFTLDKTDSASHAYLSLWVHDAN